MIYLKSDGPHQMVMIVCVNAFDSRISFFSYDRKLMLSCKSFTCKMHFFAILDSTVHVQCDLAISRNTCSSISLLIYLNLFLKIKLVRLF